MKLANRKTRKRAKMNFRRTISTAGLNATGIKNFKVVESAIMHGHGIQAGDNVINWKELVLSFLV